MTVQISSISPYVTTDAQFRTVGQAISNGIAAVGWVKTADTGQVNWSTVTIPTASGSAGAPFEIYRMADSLQATDPFFLKIQYGRWNNNTNYISLFISVGTATDGAGNLTSIPNSGVSVSSAQQITPNWALGISDIPGNCYFVGDTSSLWISLWPNWNGANHMGGFGIERNRLYDGTAGNGGVTLFWSWSTAATSAGGYYGSINTHIAVPQPGFGSGQYVGHLSGIGARVSGTGIWNNTSYAIPVGTACVPRVGAPSRHVVSVLVTDNPINSQFTMTHYGVSSTFIVSNLPSTAPATMASGAVTSGLVLALKIA